jgi:hypothetical protein
MPPAPNGAEGIMVSGGFSCRACVIFNDVFMLTQEICNREVFRFSMGYPRSHVKIQDGCHTFCQIDTCAITKKYVTKNVQIWYVGSTSLLKSRSQCQNSTWPPHILSMCAIKYASEWLQIWYVRCPNFSPKYGLQHNLLWGTTPGASLWFCSQSQKCSL